MKLFRFTKQRLNPQTPFANGFEIGFGLSVGLYFVEILLKEGTENMSPTFTAGTCGLHWTGITYFGFRFVQQNLLGGSSRHQRKDLPLRTNVLVFLSIILKELGRIILGALAKI